jgi:hypothetical protein
MNYDISNMTIKDIPMYSHIMKDYKNIDRYAERRDFIKTFMDNDIVDTLDDDFVYLYFNFVCDGIIESKIRNVIRQETDEVLLKVGDTVKIKTECLHDIRIIYGYPKFNMGVITSAKRRYDNDDKLGWYCYEAFFHKKITVYSSQIEFLF